MKLLPSLFAFALLLTSQAPAFAQGQTPLITDAVATDAVKKGAGWFFGTDYSAMFLPDHVGNAIGAQFGVTALRNRLKLGLAFYARSGPINRKTFRTELPAGMTYKGQSAVNLRADHGMFGLFLAPTFNLTKDKRVQLDIPIILGSASGGFYLAGEDRKTPDGQRVSEVENQLFDGKDAGGGLGVDTGIRLLLAPHKISAVKYAVGVHYAKVFGLETYAGEKDFYDDKIRLSFGVLIGQN